LLERKFIILNLLFISKLVRLILDRQQQFILSFSREKARFRQYRLSIFANIFLRNLLLSNLSILSFFSLSKELIIDCLIKNANKIEDTSKKTRLKILKNANLFR